MRAVTATAQARAMAEQASQLHEQQLFQVAAKIKAAQADVESAKRQVETNKQEAATQAQRGLKQAQQNLTTVKSERPSSLAKAIIEAGRINKTIYLLNYIDNKEYRRRILTQLNRGEGRHAVARIICHGQRGEIRKRYREGQEDQLGALGLVTNAVVLWNTLYMEAALNHMREKGIQMKEEDISRLSTLQHIHINVLGHYSFTLTELISKGKLRPLNYQN